MTDNDSPRFDPRFDPAFQRGFESGAQGSASQQGSAQLDSAQLDARQLGSAATGAPERAGVYPFVPETSASPVATAAPASMATAPAATAPAATSASVARADFQLDDEDAVPAGFLRRRPSALLIVLLAIAAGLLAASVWLYATLRDSFAEPAALSSPGDYYVMQSLQYLAPMLATLGLATAIGVIFVFAARSK